VESVYVISSFEHSVFLELAITELEAKGMAKENILAVPLKKKNEQAKIFDTIHYSDGISLFDGAVILGTLFMILGSIYGFIWKWGPIIWGVIGLFSGLVLGFIIDFLIRKGRRGMRKPGTNATEVVLIVNCHESQADLVEQLLWDHFALGVSKLVSN